MKTLEIGQKVIWNEIESKHGKFDWLKKGMIGRVIKYSPEVKGTGKIIDYFEDGEPIIDNGLEAYYTIDFGVAGKRCISPEDLKDRPVI